jgi:hypothetical protein
MRITVAQVVNLLANGMIIDDVLREYPDLEAEDVRQALGYARPSRKRDSAAVAVAPREVTCGHGGLDDHSHELRRRGHDIVHLREEGL